MAELPAGEGRDREDQEGGPVKSFLEHLEDLRWVLIKSAVALGLAMLVCLLAANYVVRIVEWPLKRAPRLPQKEQRVRVMFGTNQLGSFPVAGDALLTSLAGTNRQVCLQLVPVTLGTNQLLGVQVQPEPALAREPLPIQIVNLSPAGSFVVATKVAFYGGMLLAAPFILYFVAQFVFPALKLNEKFYISRSLGFATGLFLTGVAFCYFVLLPVSLTASLEFSYWLGFSSTQWQAEEYIGFVCKFLVGMGLGFELPVVLLTLVKLGILSYSTLAAGRRYVIVISFVLGAVLTTPEVVTQLLMAVPLYLLYEITLWVAWYWERQAKKRAALEDTAL